MPRSAYIWSGPSSSSTGVRPGRASSPCAPTAGSSSTPAGTHWRGSGCLPSPGMVAKLIALVVPLGLDTFGVAAGLGMVGVSGRRRGRLTLLFTGFETGMPLVGLLLGVPLAKVIGSAADYVAIAVLLSFGV